MKNELVILDGLRTPFCRAGSALAEFDAVELGSLAATALLTRTGIDPAQIDEVIFGCVGQPAHAQNIARVIALRSGIPQDKPAVTVHRNCASGLEAITTAFDKLRSGHGELFLVGGTESMSQMPLLYPRTAAAKFAALGKAKTFGQRLAAMAAFRPADFSPVFGLKLGLTCPVAEMGMGQTAEVLARDFGITREAQDRFALESHQKAAKARAALAVEITPVAVNGKAITEDNGIRADSTLAKLATLKAMFDPVHGTVTAGNSSQITDGAVALLVASEAKAAQLGLKPLGRLVDYAVAGCDPARMGLGPVRALDNLCHRTGTRLADADLVEINEAFAVQVLSVIEGLRDKAAARRCGLEEPLGEIDPAKLNPQGGAIAIGHPVGASGARLVLSALHQLRAGNKQRALVSLCVGGGQGAAALLEAM